MLLVSSLVLFEETLKNLILVIVGVLLLFPKELGRLLFVVYDRNSLFISSARCMLQHFANHILTLVSGPMRVPDKLFVAFRFLFLLLGFSYLFKNGL